MGFDLNNIIEDGKSKLNDIANSGNKLNLDDINKLSKNLSDEMMSQYFQFTSDQFKKIAILHDDTKLIFEDIEKIRDNQLKEVNLVLEEFKNKITNTMSIEKISFNEEINNIVESAKDRTKFIVDHISKDVAILAKEFKDKESEIIGFYNKIENIKADAIEKIKKIDKLIIGLIADMEDKIIDRMELYIVDNLFSLLFKAAKRFVGLK